MFGLIQKYVTKNRFKCRKVRHEKKGLGQRSKPDHDSSYWNGRYHSAT